MIVGIARRGDSSRIAAITEVIQVPYNTFFSLLLLLLFAGRRSSRRVEPKGYPHAANTQGWFQAHCGRSLLI